MDNKYTPLLELADPQLTVVPQDATLIAWNPATRVITETLPGRPVPAPAPGVTTYLVSNRVCETMFAVKNAIRCTAHDGTEFLPGFHFSCRMRYITPVGLENLLRTASSTPGRIPDCITLENFCSIIREKLQSACASAATAFTSGQTLTYTRWWEEITQKTDFRDQLYIPLMRLFNNYGFRLEQGGFALPGLAPIPLHMPAAEAR